MAGAADLVDRRRDRDPLARGQDQSVAGEVLNGPRRHAPLCHRPRGRGAAHPRRARIVARALHRRSLRRRGADLRADPRPRQKLHHEANRRAGEARPADARAMGTGSRLSEGQTLMTAPTFRQLKDEYAALWHSMIVKPDKLPALDRIARKLIAGKPRYQAVAAKTGVPWAAVALIHQMECG